MGQPNVGAGILRAADLKGDLDHRGASGFFRGLLAVLRQLGRSGLVLVLDEVETIQRVRGDSREKSLNALRQLIDDIDAGHYPGMYVLMTGTPQFFDGPQGVRRLAALEQRLHVDFSAAAAEYDNPRAVQIRLPAFDRERLIEVGRKIRDLYPSDNSERIHAKVGDDVIALLADGVAGQLGGKVGIAPRLFLRRLVDILDRVDTFDDFDPGKDYDLVLKVGEMSPEEARRGKRASHAWTTSSSTWRRARRRRWRACEMTSVRPALRRRCSTRSSTRWASRELRPVQELTIDAVLDGNNCVVLAPTAGGKTEAAFFPLVSQMDERELVAGVRASTSRRSARCSTTRRSASSATPRWSAGARSSGTATSPLAQASASSPSPADILLTTPESLEVMLMSSQGAGARACSTGLQAVVIDEIHAFADDDRGAHLSAVLERLTRFCGRDIQRIGLSATVGNPDDILRWVAGSSQARRAPWSSTPAPASASPRSRSTGSPARSTPPR